MGPHFVGTIYILYSTTAVNGLEPTSGFKFEYDLLIYVFILLIIKQSKYFLQ